MKHVLPLCFIVIATGVLATGGFSQIPSTFEWDGTGTIEVTVKRPGGAPVDNADVTLNGVPFPSAGDSVGATSATVPLTAAEKQKATNKAVKVVSRTDREGRVVFRNLLPGKYEVEAERLGFLSVRANGSTGDHANAAVQVGAPPLSADVTRSDQFLSTSMNPQVRLTLAQGSVIAGRVRNAKGRPLSGATISLMQSVYKDGRRYLVQRLPAGNETDDLGEFRIFWLPPGDYYIRMENRGDDFPREGNLHLPPLYHPGVTDVKFATKIILKEGQEAGGIDITIPRDPGVKVSGNVVNTIAEGRPSSWMYLVHTDAPMESAYDVMQGLDAILGSPDSASPDKSEFPFEIAGVTPGSYQLYASYGETWSRTRIDVGTGEIDGVTITLKRGATLRAHVSLPKELEPEFNRIGILSIDKQSNDNGVQWGTKVPSSDGGLHFEIANVMQSRYRFDYDSKLPADVYLADMRHGDKSLYNAGAVDVGSESVDVELVFARKGGVVQGRVDIPSLGDIPSIVSVVLAPEESRRGNDSFYRRVEVAVKAPDGVLNSEPTAEFIFRGIAPGNYRLLAWDYLLGGDQRNPEHFSQYDRQGIPIVVKADTVSGDTRVPLVQTR